jgi:hypothetical protein
MRQEKSEIRDALTKTGVLDEATEASLKAALEEFVKRWNASHAK